MDELINKLSAMTCSHEALKGIKSVYLYTVSETRERENMLIPVDEDYKKPLR